MRKLLVLGFVLLSFSAKTQSQQDHIQKSGKSEELKQLKTNYHKALRTGTDSSIYQSLRPLFVHYNATSEWDSLSKYSIMTSDYAKKAGDIEVHLKLLMNDISVQEITSGSSELRESRFAYLHTYLGDSTLSDERQYSLRNTLNSDLIKKGYGDSAIVIQKDAVKYAKRVTTKPQLYVSAITELGNSYQKNGQYAQSLTQLLKAESLLEESLLPPFAQFNLYQVIGTAFASLEDDEKTLEYFKKAFELAEENGYSASMHRMRIKMAVVLNRMGEHSLARRYLSVAMAYFKEKKNKEQVFQVHLYHSMIYQSEGRYREASSQLDSAEVWIQSHLLANKYSSFVFYCERIKVALAQRDLPAAISAMRIIENNNLQQGDVKGHYIKLQYSVAKMRGDTDNALRYHERYIAKRDSAKSSLLVMNTQRLESEFNRREQDARIESLNQLNAAQDKALAVRNTALILGSIMLLILGGLLFGLYRLYVANQRSQTMLSEQNILITRALDENKMLIKEIHHRVKNNLQVISSLLNMQARKVQDVETKDALKSSKTRVQSMSILHQNLYQGDNLKDVEVGNYMSLLVQNVIDTYQVSDAINFHVEIDPVQLDIDTLVPLGLIANELICNALKYAFADRATGNVYVSLKVQGEEIILRVADDGVGLPDDTIPDRAGSLGARLVYSFTEKLDGRISIVGTDGADISITFDKDRLLGFGSEEK